MADGRLAGRLTGRVAVITGSGEGIGRSIAQRFAEEGANILVAEINPELGEAAAAELAEITETRFVRTDVGS
jgi:NAD(P)-dependent dehydrogenase (short-subunit alcohol dehydrogenase family)